MQLPVFGEDGRHVHQRGVTAAPGLYFLGLPWQHTRGPALLGWVKDDAEHVAEQIATFAGTSTTGSAAVLPGGPPPGGRLILLRSPAGDHGRQRSHELS